MNANTAAQQPLLNGLVKILLAQVIFCLYLTSLTAWADQAVYRFDNVTAGLELGDANVLTLLQDRTGYIWAGTTGGLYRYNAYEWKVFKHQADNPHSLAHNQVQSLFEDRRGQLWVGTREGVLHRYNPKTESFTRYAVGNRHQETLVSTSTVSTITEDHDNTLWLGTIGGGISRFDPVSEQFVARYRHDPLSANSLSDDRIYALVVDEAGQLWVGHPVWRIEPAGQHEWDFQAICSCAGQCRQFVSQLRVQAVPRP